MPTLLGAMPREDWARQPLCADIDGLSPHVAVRVEEKDGKQLEQLCGYITRPALAHERVHLNADGQAEPKLKTPWCDGMTHLVMSPPEFMQRLAALVTRPSSHRTGGPDSGRPCMTLGGRWRPLVALTQTGRSGSHQVGCPVTGRQRDGQASTKLSSHRVRHTGHRERQAVAQSWP